MHFLERVGRILLRDINQGPYWEGPLTGYIHNPAPAGPPETVRVLPTTNVASTSQVITSQVVTHRPTDRRPSRSPSITTFPPELLETIFTFLTLHDMEYSSGSSPEIAVRAASQVCQHWRRAAFGCHRLWGAVIDYNKHHPRWIRELQARSRDAPLDIRATLFPSKPAMVQALIQVLERIHTCRSLCLGMPTISLLRSILPSIQRPAQDLEVFRLYVTGSIGGKLPETLFDGSAPRLREFVIRGSAIDLRAPVLQHLTCSAFQTSLPIRSPVSEWLSTLGRMPNIEVLDLRQVFSASTGSCNPIRLAKLFDLNIEDYLLPCGIFLANLHSPGVIHLTTKCEALPGTDLSHPLIGMGFRHHLRNWTDSPSCHTMLLELSSKNCDLTAAPNGNPRHLRVY
ncbi:hypothetical protein BD779DRAFT_1675556 [Infundibulicybe gibba]|nr:hypothetical protein BD779DRAFT_1675556 [Infundibulicybe gibba]